MVDKSISKQTSVVSVVVPVRNGGDSLRLVLEGLVLQSFQAIEILISDNASTDFTAEVCKEFANRDERIKYFRHPQVLSAAANFRYWLSVAKGKYVIFAAHDDLRNKDFIARLVAKAERDEKIACVTPSVKFFSLYAADPFAVADAVNGSAFSGVGRLANRADLGLLLRRWGGAVVYGLIRRDVLLAYTWPEVEVHSDVPLNVFLISAGVTTHAEDAVLYYFRPHVAKTPLEAALANFIRGIRPFIDIRMAVACTKVAMDASNFLGRKQASRFLFFWFYWSIKWPRFVAKVFAIAPRFLQVRFKEVKCLMWLR